MYKEAVVATSNLFAQTGREIFAPRINKLLLRLERKIKLASSWKEQFEDYWMELAAKFYTVNNVVLGHTQRTLQSIYVPMDFQLEISDNQIYKADCFPKVLLDQYGKLLIKDTIGMGKTTMLKYMFLDVISKENGFPIFVELRNLSRNHGLVAEIQTQLSRLNKEFDYNLMLDFFHEGGFIFFLDGFDEIEESDRCVVVKEMSTFISKAYMNQFIMTSRKEDSLVGFGDFVGAKVLPLSLDSLINLLQKYGGSASKTKSLVLNIENGAYSDIEDFLHIPLLAGLLYKAFIESGMSELKIYQLCCNIFPVFFDQHDLSKDAWYTHQKRVKLSSDDYERILGYMGLYTISHRLQSFSQLEFSKMTKFAEMNTLLIVNDCDLCYDLTINIPIFCKDGTKYRWIHPSLCSYYFARYIYFESKEKAIDILHKLFHSDSVFNYELILRMFSEMDPVFFDQHILSSYLSSLLVSCHKTKTDWIDFIGKDLSSSDPSRIRTHIIYCTHPELFEQVPNESRFVPFFVAEKFCLSKEKVEKFVSYQKKVTLLDDTPDALIAGL